MCAPPERSALAITSDAGIVDQEMATVGGVLLDDFVTPTMLRPNVGDTRAVMRKPCRLFSVSQSRPLSAIASAERSHIATLQPAATSCRANAWPMPVPPPVITAVLPKNRSMRAQTSSYSSRRIASTHSSRPCHASRHSLKMF